MFKDKRARGKETVKHVKRKW